jgi:4-amino-4-deoxy-L-arabinose transferase-like glycosyltransferase
METYVLRAGKLVPRTRLRALDWTTTVAPVALITALAAVLRLWAFDRVPGNPFYDAAVRSMSLSWHNFFFGAMEPAGQVSVDKAPADLWLQVAAVKLFGFSGVVVRLPEVLAAVAAIPLLYDLVRRLSGRTAGLGAALALAVLPAAIVTAHSDTMDSVMMLLDVAAAWLAIVSGPVAAGAMLGLAFNVKLFEALLVAPALVVLIALTAPRRGRALGGFAAATVGVGVSWIAIASLVPLAHRPWPFGSTDGSIWSSVFGYNGVDRIGGAASTAALKLDPPGPLRFFGTSGHQYLWLVGTALVPAIVLPLLALVRGWRPKPPAGAVFFGAWLLTGVVLLSAIQRMEPRYLETTTPAIAAAIGIGAAALSRKHAIVACCLVAALAAPAAGAVWVAGRHESDAGLGSRTKPAQLAVLSGFLATHTRGARYEVASSAVYRSAPLIVHDARPVLVLAGQGGRQLVTPARLASLVVAGDVRYALLSRLPTPSVRWALQHGHDISGSLGLPPHTLYRLTATARPPATARSAHRAGHPRA